MRVSGYRAGAAGRTRQQFRYGALAAVLVLTVALGIGFAPSSSASGPGCPSVKLFGLRGSYENAQSDGYPYGGILNAVRANLPGASNSSLLQEEGIPAPGYPATILPPTSTTIIDGVAVLISDFSDLARALVDTNSGTRKTYEVSKNSGYSALAAELRSFASTCGGSRFVLIGYSQGAHIAGDMTQTLLNEGLSGVPSKMWIGTVLLGDPAFNPTGGDSGGNFNGSRWGILGRRGAYPASADGKILSLCMANDVICGFPRSLGGAIAQIFDDPKAHFKYGSENYANGETYTGYANAWLANLVKPYVSSTPSAVSTPAPTAQAPGNPGTSASASVRLTQGPSAASGYRYAVVLSGFSPNASVSVECYDSAETSGFYAFSLHTDGSGGASTSSQCYSGDGPDHWVTANGIESNHVAWGSAARPAQSTPATQPPPAPTTYTEQEGHHGVNTFMNYHNASGEGAPIAAAAYVQVSCKVYDPYIESVNPDGYWYRIADSPWNGQYYSPANTFMNGDPWGGPYTHNTDFNVPNC